MKRYIEFSFYLPFFDLIDDTDGVFSLEELMRQLNIRFNIMELYNQYLSIWRGFFQSREGRCFCVFHEIR